jgi:hypothetical protein
MTEVRTDRRGHLGLLRPADAVARRHDNIDTARKAGVTEAFPDDPLNAIPIYGAGHGLPGDRKAEARRVRFV